MYDIIIVGMGISGITAGIYAKRSNKKVLLLDKGLIGGILNNIDCISNYPGLLNIKGIDFANVLEEQIKSLNIEYKLEEALSYNLDNDIKEVRTKKNIYKAKKIILALGRKPKYLGLNNEEELLGRGISTCAMCDAYFYKDKPIAVVGAGNCALSESLYLANIVSHLYLLNRREGFRAEESLVEKVKQNKKIEILYNVNIKEIIEENKQVSKVYLDNNQVLEVKGVFIYIGQKPATENIDKKILDEEGYIKVNEKLETNIKNVYAIGDCIKKDTYQLTTAVSDGTRVISNMNW